MATSTLAEHVAGVDFVLEEEGAGARGRFAVENGPVDGSRSAILGQQRAVQVHGAQGRAVPNGFGQHPKRHHHAQVGIPRVEQGMKVRRLQRPGCRQRQAVFFGNLLDFTGAQGPSASSRPIRSRHHPDDFVPALEQLFEACGGKLRGSEKHDAQALQRSLRQNSCCKGQAQASSFKEGWPSCHGSNQRPTAEPTIMHKKYTQSARQMTSMGCVQTKVRA